MKISLSFLRSVITLTLIATIVLATVVLLPFTDNFLFQSKYFIFVFATLLMGFIFAVYSIRKGSMEIILSPFTTVLLMFGGAVAASTFFTNNYPVEALVGMGGIYLAFVLFVLFSSTVIDKRSANYILPTITISAGLLSLFATTQLIGYGPANLINQVFGLDIPATVDFSVAGSPFAAMQVIILALIGIGIDSYTKKHISKISIISAPILLIGLAIHIWAILPGKPGSLILPSWGASWSIALDTIRTPRAALIGIGPDSYTNAYTRFKPLWINGTEQWSFIFNQASNVPFTLLTTTGFIGLAAWLSLAWVTLQAFKKAVTPDGKVFAFLATAVMVAHFFIPANAVTLTLLAVLLAGLIANERTKYGVLKIQALAMTIEKRISDTLPPIARPTSFPVYLSAGAMVLGLLMLTYLTGRAYAASAASFQASKAFATNDAVRVYERQQQAVRLNPYLDVYRRQYSATNLLIAVSLANKTDATEQEKEQVSQLLQQAVREAQSATLLDPFDVKNWGILAQIYQNMVGSVEQADQFAIQAYVQAIQNDPTNPILRVNVGGILLSKEQYQDALSLFNQAIEIKPDYPNSYYNAAFVLQKLNALPQAKQAYQTLLSLLDPASEDYTKVTQELELVEESLSKQADATKSGQLTPSANSSSSLIQQTAQDSADVINAPVNKDVSLDAATPLGTELKTAPAAPEETPSP